MNTRKNRTQGRRRIEKLARAIGRGPAGFERLEDRTMLSNSPILVTNTLDDGSMGSLRWAIDRANAASDADTIEFSGSLSDSIIHLQDGLTITNPLTITGLAKPGEGNNPLIWLDGDNAFAPLTLEGNNITIAGLGFTHFTASPAIVVQGSGNHVGVAGAAARNVFFGNYAGIEVQNTADQTSIVGNVISASDVSGVSVDGATHVTVASNLIGIDYALDPSDPTFVPGPVYVHLNNDPKNLRGAYGVYVTNTALDSSVLIDGNAIAAAGDGVRLDNAAGVTVTRNRIGTDPSGSTSSFLAYGNAIGVHLMGGSHDNVIGALDPANGNVVAGSEGNGIWINEGSNDNQVLGNRVGVDADGTSGDGTFGNRNNGVEIDDSTGNLIAGNVIANNLRDGVRLLASGNTVYGNQIGGKDAGGFKVGNGWEGVHVEGDGNVIGGPADGQGNVIAFNGDAGVAVVSGAGNSIRGNSIHDNSGSGEGAGIDLYEFDDLGLRVNDGPTANRPAPHPGPNNYQHFPTLLSAIGPAGAIKVSGYLDDAVAGQTYTFDVYANATGSADGEIYLGAVTVTATTSGRLDFTGTFDKVNGQHLSLTATTTDQNGNTSEFSGALDATIVVPVATTTTLTSSAPITRPGKNVTFTAAVVVSSNGANVAGGKVTFFDGNDNPLGTADVVNGLATLTVSTLSLGGHTITATYAAAPGYLDSTSAPLAHTVAKAASTTTVTSSANPGVAGSPITLTATVTVAPGEDAPTGTVTFKDGNTVLATNVLLVNGVATVDLSWLPAGTHAITATFTSTAATVADSSGALSQQVNKAGTTTTVSSPGAVTVGTPVTLTATVTFPAGVPITGSVAFYDGSTLLGSVNVDASGKALFAFTPSTVATHTIKAVYSGDANLNTSQGTTSQVVIKANSTITIADVNAVVGTDVTLRAHVVDAFNHPAAGTVHFLVDGVDADSGTLDGGGNASVLWTFMSAGAHVIQAVYDGNATVNGSSATGGATITRANSVTSLLPVTAVVGATVDLGAHVTGEFGTVDGGTLHFIIDGVDRGSRILNGGNAFFSWTFTTAGAHTITATYDGNANVYGSSATAPQAVDKATSTTTVTPTTATVGTPATLAAHVAGNFGFVTGGLVHFIIDGVDRGAGTLDADGNAILSWTFTTAGAHAIKAVYDGNANLYGSFDSKNADITKAASVTTIADVNTIVGTQASLSAHVVDQFNHAATGTVHFLVDGVDRDSSTLDSGGNAVLPWTFNTVGAHVIKAVYDGSATINGSSATGAAAIAQAASTTTVTLPSDAVVGRPTTLTATVASGFAPLGGTVTFFENDLPIGTGALAADGTVSINYTFNSATNHTITATYNGDANHADSTGSATTSVAKADTTVSLTSSANPSVVGNPVTFTANVGGGYGGLAGGSVVFMDGTVALATVTVGAGNTATFTTTFQTVSGHQITAVFVGNANSAASTSDPVNQVVNQAATTTTLTASATSTTFGQDVTFTAAVGVLGSPLAATGVVRFFDGTTLLGEVALSGTQASLTVSNLAGGAHAITATYVGADTHLASTSNSVAVNVTVPSTDVPFQASGHTLRDTTGNGLSADDTALGNVTVKIFKDANNNGVLDAADTLFTTVVSNSSGVYSLSINAAGRYFAQELTPAGYLQTAPVSGYYTFTASANNAATSLDFSNWKQCDCCDDLTNVTYIINGTTHVADLRGNTHPGDVVQVVFTVPAGSDPMTLSLVSYTAPSGVWDATVASQQKIWEQQTGTFGPGTYTLTVNLPDTFYQVDFVCGPVIDKLGPAGSSIFYSAQNRLISADNSGSIAYVEGSSSLSGFVYNDLDNDGVQDNNEPGIAGVKVLLSGKDAAGNTITRSATTDSRGRYAFANVTEGTYSVTETQPAGYLNGKETPTNAFSNVKITATRGSRTGYNFGELVASKLAGFVYVDANNDGVKQSTEKGLAGVTLSLVNANGSVVATTTTDSAGAYTFGTVAAGTYSVLETQPAHYVDGIETAGTLGGDATGDNNTITAITVGSGQTGSNYNFGELPESFVTTGETATIGFWQNKNGQNLIKSFNGSATCKLLAKWLAQTFPNLYGANSTNNLNGKTNADVATLFTKLFNVSGQKLDAQVLAVALAVYGTTNSLGGTAAAKYGFTVDAIGTGHRLYNIGSNGLAFGVANNTNMEVLDILDAANDRAVNGVLYNGNTTLRNMANTVFTGINEHGDIA